MDVFTIFLISMTKYLEEEAYGKKDFFSSSA